MKTMLITCIAFNQAPKYITVSRELVAHIIANTGGVSVPLGLDGLKNNNTVGMIRSMGRTIILEIAKPGLVFPFVDVLTLDYDVDEFNMMHFVLRAKNLIEGFDENEDTQSVEEDNDSDEVEYI